MSMQLFSPAFDNGERIPDRYTKSGDNEQPELMISNVPEGAQELAVICHDPDAPMPNGFTHWLLYGIPAGTEQIPMNGEKQFRPGVNDFNEVGWGGPMPPQGHGPHHYHFWLYALDTPVSGMPNRETFLRDYGAHVMDQSRIIGLYER